MAEAVLLLLLAERPQHGYELAQRIAEEELVAGRVRGGRVYETLARLSALGFVEADNEPSSQGPDRHRYHLTVAGHERLARWRSGLERSWRRIGYFIRRHDHQLGFEHGHPHPVEPPGTAMGAADCACHEGTARQDAAAGVYPGGTSSPDG